jgi:hypothetical protein
MKFIEPFLGCKAGDVYPTQFLPGAECPPELEGAARAVGAIGEPPTPDAPPGKASSRRAAADGGK